MGLEWNADQRKIAALLQQGMTPLEIAAQGIAPRSSAYRIQDALTNGDVPNKPVPPEIPASPKPVDEKSAEKPKPAKSKGLPITGAVTESAFLQLTPQVQMVILTPSIFISYVCALKRGYKGNLGNWLSLTCEDFWSGREINMYEEVTGIATKPS